MKTIEISYNPYKMITKMLIDKIDVCQNRSYEKIREFIEHQIPLQTWIEPIDYLDWSGFVNEISDPETNDEVNIVFSGRVIDFEDLKRSITDQNEERTGETRVIYHFEHKKILDDKVLSQNIEAVVKELQSERFRSLVSQRTSESLTEKYKNLEENYKTAKENLFYIVLAGAYSSGKSTLLNTLIRHEVLPTSSRTCTSRNCRIRHDASLGSKISLCGYGASAKDNGEEVIVIPKQIFDTDEACAAAFSKICPIQVKDGVEPYPDLEILELGVDLSHLYPDSVSKEQFTIVLIDTPGMDSAQSSEDGANKHAEIALEAISMETKPMIILCADANYHEHKSIGEFMKEILLQAGKENSGFNDRFLFLINKCDAISYQQGETAEHVKMEFAEYLTDNSKWNIKKSSENEIKQLAENAAHFVPRVFMTASLIAFAIQKGALDFTDEELDDPYKEDLYKKLDDFIDKICGRRKRPNFYLSRYCDIPNYRKDELEQKFEAALNEGDELRAAELQCGLISVESAIKDYIARYAYPIKVRDLLDTFEDILADVNSFTNGILADLKKKEIELGEKNSERKEASERKRGVEEKIAALKEARDKIEQQMTALEAIHFDSNTLNAAWNNFKADIDEDEEISFIRKNPIVKTGTKEPETVQNEIKNRINHIKTLFQQTLNKTNMKLEEIKAGHDAQIHEIFSFLTAAITELEHSGVFNQGEYKFSDSVTWKMYFSNINAEQFDSDVQVTELKKQRTTVRNSKKQTWSSSWNPFKRIGALFMDDYESKIETVPGHYNMENLVKSIGSYLVDMEKEKVMMQQGFENILDNSKEQVTHLIKRLLQELESFLADIRKQEETIEKLSTSIDTLHAEIVSHEETLTWLNDLTKKIKED